MSDTHVALKDSNSVASAIFESSTNPGVIFRGQIDEITGRVLVDSAGGGGFTEIAVSGTVNSNNVTFTAASEPTYLISDGTVMKKLDNNGNTQWSYLAGTITMVIPPNAAIFGWS